MHSDHRLTFTGNSRRVQHIDRIMSWHSYNKICIGWIQSFAPWLLTQNQRDSHIATVRNFWIMLVKMKTFWKQLYPTMKRGFMDTMWKWKCSLRSGLEKIRWDWNGRSWSGRMWKSCWQFFYIEGVVHHEFLHQGQTVNRSYYLEVLIRLRGNIRRKRPQLWETAPGASIMTVCQLMHHYWFMTFWPTQTHLCFLSHPTHLTWFQQTFSYFPNWNLLWKNDDFRQESMENLQTELCTVPKKAYQDCFQKWQQCWEWCISAGGGYFEGDKAHSVASFSKNIIENSSKTFWTDHIYDMHSVISRGYQILADFTNHKNSN
jgi:hypothetical protein